MLPRALLFSSDEQTSTVLRQVVKDLQIDLVHCREIFAAIEELTTRSFQAILIDWGQELEASFLLNMARELKSTKNTYSLVIADRALVGVLAVNPDAFLEKPFTAEQAQSVILSCPQLGKLAKHSEHGAVSLGSPTRFENPTFAKAVIPPYLSSPGHLQLEAPDFETIPTLAPKGSLNDGCLSRGFLRPEASVRKKAAALLCLVTLLVAVVHAEEQLGYLPANLLSYRNLGELLSPPKADGTPQARQFTSDSQPIAEFKAAGIENEANGHNFINFSRRTEVRPVVRENYPAHSKSAFADSEFMTAGPSVLPTEATLPTGANPLIPSSLYISPERLSRLPGSVTPLLAPTNWKAGVLAVTEETSRSLLIHQVSPNYPLEALRAGLQGPVVFEVLVGRDGTIQDLKLVRGYFALGLAAVDAVKQWRFRPYRVNGEIVQMQTFLTVNFPMVDAKDKPDSNGSLMTYGAWR